MSKISPNYGLLGTQPTIGKGARSKPVIAHYGSMPGPYSGEVLFPETERGIIVLCNTTPLCDLADWMTQLHTQILFDFPRKVNIVHWVQKTADAELKWHERIASDMQRNHKPGAGSRNLEEYVGRYFNETRMLFMDVDLVDGKLVQGLTVGRMKNFPLSITTVTLSPGCSAETISSGGDERSCSHIRII